MKSNEFEGTNGEQEEEEEEEEESHKSKGGGQRSTLVQNTRAVRGLTLDVLMARWGGGFDWSHVEEADESRFHSGSTRVPQVSSFNHNYLHNLHQLDLSLFRRNKG